MADTIRRAVQLKLQDGNVFVQDITVAGKQAEVSLNKVGDAARGVNDNLTKSGEASDRFSRQGRAAFANLGNQVQDFVVQVQGGTDAFRAFAQQAPQALDAFQNFIPALPLIGAGLAIATPFIEIAIKSFFNLGISQKEATKDALEHKQALDALEGSLGISAENAQKYQVGLKLITDQEKELLNLNLASTVRSDQQAVDASAQAIRDRVKSLTAAAEIPDVQLPGGGATVPLRVSDPDLANLRDYAKEVRDIADAYLHNLRPLSDLTDGLDRLSIQAGETDSVRAKEIDGLKENVEAYAAAQRAVDLHTAKLHLLYAEMGDAHAFTAFDQSVINHTAVLQGATEALIKYGSANRRAIIDATADLLAKTNPQAAEEYRTEKIDELHQLEKKLQDDANRNAIVLKTGLDSGEAEKLRSGLDATGHKLNDTLQEDIKNIKAAGDAMVQQGADATKTQAAVNELIREATLKRQQTADAAKKEREEQDLISSGVVRTREQADALLSSNNNILAGLTGQAKLSEQIATLEKERAALKGGDEEERRANITQQINQLLQQRNELDAKDAAHVDNILESNDKILDRLKASIAFKSGSITQDDITQAGIVAGNSVNQNLGLKASSADIQHAKDQAAAAREAGEAAKYEEFWTKADAEANKAMDDERAKAVELANRVLPPQEKLNDIIEKLGPLVDGTAEGWERYNKAIEAYTRLQPLVEKQQQQRERSAELDRLQMSENPFDWAKAGLREIAISGEDTGKAVSGALKSGFDSENHAFFELVSRQKQGWADMKSAALSFVSTLGEVAQRMLIITTIEKLVGFAGSFFSPGASGPTESQFLARDSLISAYGHSGMVVGSGSGTPKRIPAYMANIAPRYHMGGLMPDERVVVAQTGERLLNRQETRAYDARSGSGLTYNPVTNNYISGVNDPQMLAAIVETSANEANSRFLRMSRNNPDFRRRLGH